LVVPQGLPALRSIINLRILKEEAISLGKDLSIITGDILIKKLAQQAGLRILDREIREKKDDWPEQLKEGGEIRPQVKAEPEVKKGRIISDIIRPREKIEERIEPEKIPEREEVVEEEVIEEEEPSFAEATEGEKEIIHKPKKVKLSFKFFTKKRLIISGIIICLIVLIFVSVFVLPRAQVSINPKKEAIRFETEIIANKNIDSINFADSSIPAQVFQLETED